MTVLIVEDDPMVAGLLEETLVKAGFEVCGIARTIAEALDLGERRHPDLGVIDVRLSGGEYGTEVAAALRRRGRFGVLYATGDPGDPILSHAEGEGCITKPYLARSIVSALRIVSERMDNRPTSTFPQGFKLLEPTLTAYAA